MLISKLLDDLRGRVHDDQPLEIVGPTWRREVTFPRRDSRKLRRLAEEIEAAARNAETIRRAARADTKQAERHPRSTARSASWQ